MINLSVQRDGKWESMVVEAALIRLDQYDIEAMTITEQDGHIVLTRVGSTVSVIDRLRVEEP